MTPRSNRTSLARDRWQERRVQWVAARPLVRRLILDIDAPSSLHEHSVECAHPMAHELHGRFAFT